ncbi:MAG: hypothetical protein RL761_941 [Pseudomonadota bacterium]
MYQDGNSAKTAYFIGADADAKSDADLLLHSRFHVFQVTETVQIVQPL